jgi:glycerophosphoryl diester phosphodiesterase
MLRLLAAALVVCAAVHVVVTAQRFADVGEEMRYFLRELNVDALFTDNPDRFPR